MKLVVPYSDELNAADARLVKLVEFLGGHCEPLLVERGVRLSPGFIEKHVEDKNSCFVVNPAAIRECLSSESFPLELAAYLTSRFAFVLVHNLSLDGFSASIIDTLSKGSLHSLKAVEALGLNYDIKSEYKQVCGAFSGLTFGPVNQKNDRSFVVHSGTQGVQTYVAIGGQPFFASVQRERAEVFFLGSLAVVDLDATVRENALTEYFSQLLPAAMFVRYAFSDRCWRPNQRHATLVIDDPLLREDYGFLNYERLLALMDKYNFHTSIAFIPHNCRRNSPAVTRMFRERPDRLSICFHGNDHTAAEFASKDSGLLNAMLTVAQERMEMHQERTGIRCDNVMVFPQGNFSREAMLALKAHNFSAAVNTGPYPRGEHGGLTLRDFLDPAVLRYGGLALFLRKYVRAMSLEDVAFNLFFGKPVLLVEHHEVFKDPQCLTELVSRINAFAPEIRWSNLETAVENSYMRRWTAGGELQLRAYSNSGRIENSSENFVRCSVEWVRCAEIPLERVLLDGVPQPDVQTTDDRIRISFDLPAGKSRKFSVVYRNDCALSDANQRVQWKAKAFLRRRLSEIRDNHLSKSPQLLSAAKTLHELLFKSSD